MIVNVTDINVMLVDMFDGYPGAVDTPVDTKVQSDDVSVATPCCPPLLGPILSDDEAAELAVTIKALADPVRLKLINLIGRSTEACACDLPDLLDRSQPTVSHHLSILVKAGILHREQRGKWAWFSLNRQRLAELCAAIGTECLVAGPGPDQS
jgi:ArsR family transcriptional regulator